MDHTSTTFINAATGIFWVLIMGVAALTFHFLRFRRDWSAVSAGAVAICVLIGLGLLLFAPIETHAVKLDMPPPR